MKISYIIFYFAVVAELAYALDSGSSPRKWVRVQVPSTALKEAAVIAAASFLYSMKFLHINHKFG